jgi:hypothetical protein
MEQANTKLGSPRRDLCEDQDEFWYVLAGEFIVEVGSDRYQAQPGTAHNDVAIYRGFRSELVGPPLSLK